MSEEELVSGIAIVVDDEIDDARANINTLLKKIKGRMPCVTYSEIPKDAVLKHWKGVSFVLLDWKLENADVSAGKVEGVKVPDTVSQSIVDDNISFLTKLKDICFVPVFIFTNEDVGVVKKVLHEKGLYQDGKPNYIFVESKSALIRGNKLISKIEKWIKCTPSIYVLKVWDNEYQKSKTKLFHDFYEISPIWPQVLWDSFAKDGSNMSFELGEMISRNLCTRMAPFSFNERILNRRLKKIGKNEVRKVFEGERFIKEDKIHKDTIATGDVFKISGKIYLNIRPDCDCILTRGGSSSGSVGDLDLYLLEGSKLSADKEKKCFLRKYGHFDELDCQAIVFSMIDGNTYDFRFKNLSVRKWTELKDKRIGRLLPPHIVRIQQRYSLYLQRLGMPRIPQGVFSK